MSLVLNITTDDYWLIMEQHRDQELSKIIQELNRAPDSHVKYEVVGGVLCLKKESDGKICYLKVVPKSYQWSLINHYHQAIKHFGWEKMLDKIKETYWFENMSSLVRKFIDNCVVCKTMKGPSGATQVNLHPIEKIAEPFHTVHIDITGKLSGSPNRKEYVFVAVDAFTKFVVLIYVNHKNEDSVLEHLKNIVFLFGAPKRVIVDGDPAFMSEYKVYCELYKIELLTGKRGSVLTELLPLIDYENERIDLESFDLKVKDRMAERSEKDQIRYNKGKAKVNRFTIGEYVLVKDNPRLGTKLSPKFLGPFEVKKIRMIPFSYVMMTLRPCRRMVKYLLESSNIV